jgi:hypothetical protein
LSYGEAALQALLLDVANKHVSQDQADNTHAELLQQQQAAHIHYVPQDLVVVVQAAALGLQGLLVM